MKIKRYFRGSGRVLAFVFIASVIWLLFDMAALRFSINDVNSELLKQSVIKERKLFKQQATKVTQIMNGVFKNPVQRIDIADWKPVNAGNKVAKVYRQKPKKLIEIQRSDNKEEMVLEQIKAQTPSPKSVVSEQDREAVPQKPDLPVMTKAPAKKAVNLDQSETTAEVRIAGVNDSVIMTLPVVVPIDSKPGVQEGNPIHLPTSEKKRIHNIAHTLQSKTYAVKDEHINKSGIKMNQMIDDEPHSIDLHSSRPNNDTKRKTFVRRNDAHAAEKPLQPFAKPKLKREADFEANSVVLRKPGVHKVLSLDMTNAPRDANAVGQFGQAAVVSNEKQEEMKKRWDEGHFNVYLSDKIPIDRAVPDTRPQACAENMVHDDLPTTSVIFCFVDEVWSTLLRSVHSVLNRSPEHLLAEIILVDDFSTKDYLKEQLDVYMAQFPKVRIVRLNERQGLIRARLAGAAVAKGEVLTFLDSHIECNVGWLEPLLERVYVDRKKVACPVIEVINDKDMSYVMVDNFQRGIFKWPLVFGWSTLTGEYIKKNNMTVSDPIRCPVMAGGLFSIDKKYFYELGTYDSGLDVWGGENMEISFKIWMCGGEIEIIPCSRVGHIFRGKNPYTFPKDRQKTVERNLARVAEVWLDEYKDIFYGNGYHHLLDRAVVDIGNLTEQIELRKSLKCKSFQWYLENIYPDMDAPLVKAEGLVFNRGLRKCLALQNRSLSFEMCNLSKKSQHFNYTWLRHIQQKDLCVVPQGTYADLVLELCDKAKPSLRWFHKASNSALGEHLLAESTQMCLEGGRQGISVHLGECEPNNAFQKWQFTHYYTK